VAVEEPLGAIAFQSKPRQGLASLNYPQFNSKLNFHFPESPKEGKDAANKLYPGSATGAGRVERYFQPSNRVPITRLITTALHCLAWMKRSVRL